MGRRGYTVLFIALFFMAALVPGQAHSGSILNGFNPNANDTVFPIALQADGRILIGGIFTTVRGEPRNGIARLNTDGTLDTLFDPDANNYVFSITPQADGKILVGGIFTAMGGVARNGIARLNADGSLDTLFDPDVNGDVRSIAPQADGKILIGGAFTTMGGVAQNGIARLNPDGTLDADFNPNTDNYVFSITPEADGKILVGGIFTAMCGVARNRIARLNPDGSLDTGFDPNANNNVYSIALQADGKILAGGIFTTMGGGGGVVRNRIARLNADGTLDTLFDPNANNNYVFSIALQADGKILAGGDFTTMGGITRNNIARLNADGSLDTGFNHDANNYVLSIALQADGAILIGGQFTALDGFTRNHIARVTNTHAALQELGLSSNGSTVTWMRGQASPELGRVTFDLSTDGVTWTSLGNGTRITGGWQFTGPSLPVKQSYHIRARGYASGGYLNASGSLLEVIRLLYVPFSVNVKGDINDDHEVNLADATLALQAIIRLHPTGIRPDFATSGSDVDNDGKIGFPEVLYILQKAAEMRQ